MSPYVQTEELGVSREMVALVDGVRSDARLRREITDAYGPARSSQSGLPLDLGDRWGSSVTLPSGVEGQLVLKRMFDVLFAVAAILALLPLLCIVAVLVKITSPGPVLFRQIREGLDGKPFEALKFRSMRSETGDASGIQQTVVNDDRVTPLGRFLRRTSIDELPQLLNVLKGDMSVVGPRPHVPGMKAAGRLYRDLVPYYDARLKMRPGITGWAQANGLRGMTQEVSTARARVDHDLAYIQNYSFLLDIKIILLTAQKEFLSGSGH